MGNYINKLFSSPSEIEDEETEAHDDVVDEKDVMQTPQAEQKALPIDPRSVTTGIERTPIEINQTPVGLNRRVISAIPRYLQRQPYLETDIDKVMLCLTPKKHSTPQLVESIKTEVPHVEDINEEVHSSPTDAIIDKKLIADIQKERYNILGLDPRSPAADFDRTPILMPKSLQRLKARSQLNLCRRGSYETDVFYSRYSYCETSSQFNVPEIQVLPDLAACTVKSLNLSNTDCDDKTNESSCSSQSSTNETICESEEEEQVGTQGEVKTTSEESSCNGVPAKKEVHGNDHDTIKVWRDSLVLENAEPSQLTESNDVQVVPKTMSKVPKEEIMITFDDDSCIAKDTLSLKMSKFDGGKKKVEVTGRDTKIVKSKIKIATDEKKTFNSNDKKGNESPMIRTPLRNRSNNGQMQTHSTNSPQQVFRSKGITPRMLQENTPPHKKYVVKSKLSGMQWDPDSTVII